MSKSTPASSTETPRVKAGGVELAVPGPGNFPEVGDRLRTTLFEVLTPSTNRLLSAYVPQATLTELTTGKVGDGLRHYAMLQVPRQAEYVECTPETFTQVLQGVESSMGNLDAKIVGDLGDEMNMRLKSLGSKSIEINRPEMLGGIFKKTDVSGFAMLVAFKQGERTVTMATTLAILRVKQKLLFAYFYKKYESPETVRDLSKDLEKWTDALLSANK
ncbi:hypothetical protein [Paludibaculum fermentans]|uniref:hypothetical protein n=1 Tax=Paludibaculum fermentans TaxID=1473598 RepID=UPI003EBD14AE